MFTKYPHLEKLGNNEVEGILDGECFIFPKLDGTNASVWYDEINNMLAAGSRTRQLSLENDNAGFFNAMSQDYGIKSFLAKNKSLILYGEWLVPHTLKTYEEDAWRKFYIFDVFDRATGKFLSYDKYTDMLDQAGLTQIRPIAIVRNPTEETLYKALPKATFLVQDGKGAGEGIVLKNYNFVNRYGRVTWLKVVTNAFKTRHGKEMGVDRIENKRQTEQKIVDKFLDVHAIEKEYAKIVADQDGFSNKHIPRLLNVVYYEMVKDHVWDMVKDFKNPTIDYKILQRLSFRKVKELKPELF